MVLSVTKERKRKLCAAIEGILDDGGLQARAGPARGGAGFRRVISSQPAIFISGTYMINICMSYLRFVVAAIIWSQRSLAVQWRHNRLVMTPLHGAEAAHSTQ